MSISLLSLTLAAITNGLNPCGIGMMITFLGYLLVFGQNKKDKYYLWKLGAVYIGAVFATYLFIGLLFYSLAFYLQRLWLASVFKYVIGGVIFLAGLIQIKDGIWPDSPIHLRMPDFGGKKINQLMARMSLPMAALVGVAVTAFSTPCMLPLYVGTATVIARSGLPMALVLAYFLYYNLIFILPLIVVLAVMGAGKEVVAMKEMEHKYGRWMRLLMGLVLVVVGYLIIF
ncbi:MAG TPA: hypothetical protein VI791_03800 [Patescibacteria group bacterium]|nr:MAG: hypothetical protein UY37_C0014G0021 [Candidatus Beckwithbacteria bacterium GW2011_GWC2_49_11]HLE50243.1 hypothetical protein [Patescibacteria group bacterium]